MLLNLTKSSLSCPSLQRGFCFKIMMAIEFYEVFLHLLVWLYGFSPLLCYSGK